MPHKFNIISIALLALGLLDFVPATMAQPLPVDVAPFGQPLREEGAVGVQWPEMRRILSLEVTFADDGSALPQADTMKVQYWRGAWNGAALRRYGDQNAGSHGWNAADDWTNGEWKTADARAHFNGPRRATFTFAPSGQQEFPNLKDPDVTYRPSLKIRVAFSAAHPPVALVGTFTDSTLRSSNVQVHFENRASCDDPVEVYNGSLIEKSVATADHDCVLHVSLSYAFNPEDPEADRAIVTVRSRSNPFSFAVDEVERGDHIYIKDFGVLVARSPEMITTAMYRQVLQEAGTKSVYDRVESHPEQTLSQAWNDMPLKRPYYFI